MSGIVHRIMLPFKMDFDLNFRHTGEFINEKQWYTQRRSRISRTKQPYTCNRKVGQLL